MSGEIRVLLVFDRPLASLVSVALRHSHYVSTVATDGRQLERIIADVRPDLAMVDIDAYESLIEPLVNEWSVPVIAYTRKRETAVKLRAFEKGADDIIEVPFTLDEVIARPFALLRRRGITTHIVPRITIGGGLEVDLMEQTVKMNGGPRLELTPIQQSLLYVLAANVGEVLTREELLSSIWGNDFQIESNVVDRHIRELRVKLGDDWRTPRYIETVAGRGYRFRQPVAHEALVTADAAQ